MGGFHFQQDSQPRLPQPQYHQQHLVFLKIASWVLGKIGIQELEDKFATKLKAPLRAEDWL
jgi:hypothetical protein